MEQNKSDEGLRYFRAMSWDQWLAMWQALMAIKVQREEALGLVTTEVVEKIIFAQINFSVKHETLAAELQALEAGVADMKIAVSEIQRQLGDHDDDMVAAFI
jgi:hypothetical protein